MKVAVEPAPRFLRDLKNLSSRDREQAIDAVKRFADGERSKALNFERIVNGDGQYTIRANQAVRIRLQKINDRSFVAQAVGNHDYIYTAKRRR